MEEQFILFGAGQNGVKALEEYGKEKVGFFCDNAVAKIGTFIEDKEVISFQKMCELYEQGYCIVVTPCDSFLLCRQLEENGIDKYIIYRSEIDNNQKKGKRINDFYKENQKLSNRYNKTCIFIHNKWLLFRMKRKLRNVCPKKYSNGKYAIVIQGPINDSNIEKIIEYYRWAQPTAMIIVSTWKTINKDYLLILKEKADYIVLNDEPSVCGRANINYQIVSTREGIKKAKEIGAEYVLKARSNSLIWAKNLFETYENWVKKDKDLEHIKYGLKYKILSEYRDNFNDKIPFGICDFTFLGYIDDMLKLWDIPLDINSEFSQENMSTLESEKKMICNKTTKELFEKRLSGVLWLSLGFCDKIGYPYACDNRKSKQYLKDLFLFLDRRCEMIFKYENINADCWSIKPILSSEARRDFKLVIESIDYNTEILYPLNYFYNRGHLDFIMKKNH